MFRSSSTKFPREKLFLEGVSRLSDVELLAILIGSGTRGNNVFRIATELLKVFDKNKNKSRLETFMKIKGMGSVKAAQITAAFEFSRRRLCPDTKKISYPVDIIPLITHYADRKQECFLSLSMNGAHEVNAVRIVSVGLVNKTIVHPREVFADPIIDRAAAIIVAHNHPSGNVKPSREDIEITARLKEAGLTLGISLLDHIIFSQKSYYSFLENGII